MSLTRAPDNIYVVATAERAEHMEEKPLLIIENLTQWLDEQGIGTGNLQWQRLGKNRTHGTYEIQRDDVRFVLRRETTEPREPGTHDLKTEVELLALLTKHHMRVPQVTRVVDDPEIIGAPFVMMDFVDGAKLVDSIPPNLDSFEERHGMCRRAVDDLARIHVELDVKEFRKFDLKNADFQKELLIIRRLGRKSLRNIPGFEIIYDYLSEKVPKPADFTVVHGDYSLRNLVYSHNAPAHVNTIFGWDHLSLGDPMMDLAKFTAFYADYLPETPLETAPITREDAFLSRRELANVYQLETRWDTSLINWYETFYIWKRASELEQLWTLFQEGERPKDTKFTLSLRAGIPQMLANAATISRIKGVDANAGA